MKNLLKLIVISISIISIQNTFLSNIFYQLNKDKKGQNLIISPLSIYQVLSLLSNGARGETLNEMLEVLGSPNTDDLNYINEKKIINIITQFSTLDIANAIMTKCEPTKSLLLYAKAYSANVELLENVEQVNNWCSENTHGKINQIIEELDPNTVMILLNAVYFKGKWVYPFEKYVNQKLPFYNLGKDKILLDTMIQEETFNYYQDSEVQIVELPFEEDLMSAIIILPSENIEINKYIKTSLSKINELINKSNYVKVHLELPKFELEFDENINDALKKLGMKKIFDNKKADLSGLCKDRNDLFVDSVIHKTYLKVNEDGTEAAAITAVIAELLSVYDSNKKEELIYRMIVNRPFLFLLKNSRLPEGYNMVFISKIEKIEKENILIN